MTYMPHVGDLAREAFQMTVADVRTQSAFLEGVFDRLQYFAIDYPEPMNATDCELTIRQLQGVREALERAEYNLEQLKRELENVDKGRDYA